MRRLAPQPPRAAAAPAAARAAVYPNVPREVAAEAYSRDPNSVVPSFSHDFHRTVWQNGGGVGEPPLAFRVGYQIRVDFERWPVDRLHEIGLAMRLPEGKRR